MPNTEQTPGARDQRGEMQDLYWPAMKYRLAARRPIMLPGATPSWFQIQIQKNFTVHNKCIKLKCAQEKK